MLAMYIMADILFHVDFHIFNDYLTDISKNYFRLSHKEPLSNRTKIDKYAFRFRRSILAILPRLCFKFYLQIPPHANILSYILIFPLSTVSQIEIFLSPGLRLDRLLSYPAPHCVQTQIVHPQQRLLGL